MLYYFSYKRFDIYLLMFLTSILPVITLELLIDMIIFFRESAFVASLTIIQCLLLSYLIYNNYQLLKINIQHNSEIYESVVKNLWVISYFTYGGLCTLGSIDGSMGSKFFLAKVIGTILGKLTVFCITYYFAVKRKSSIAIWVNLFFFHKTWVDIQSPMVSPLSKISYLGFFIYFFISSYRLHKSNKMFVLKSKVSGSTVI
jgi:hypothetical protein